MRRERERERERDRAVELRACVPHLYMQRQFSSVVRKGNIAVSTPQSQELGISKFFKWNEDKTRSEDLTDKKSFVAGGREFDSCSMRILMQLTSN